MLGGWWGGGDRHRVCRQTDRYPHSDTDIKSEMGDRHRVCRQTDRYTNSDTDIKSETDERRVFIEEIILNKYMYDNKVFIQQNLVL